MTNYIKANSDVIFDKVTETVKIEERSNTNWRKLGVDLRGKYISKDEMMKDHELFIKVCLCFNNIIFVFYLFCCVLL
jgi:hypothetical protein